MLQELFGFDIRVDPEDYDHPYWNQKNREEQLLRPEIKFPLSVTSSWPRIFTEFGFFPEAEYNPNLILDLWLDLEELKTYFQERKAFMGCKGVLIAAVWCRPDDKPLVEDNGYVSYSGLTMDQLPNDWIFLGYDVANEGLDMGLYGYAIGRSLRKEWAPCINEHGLFREFEDALKFTDVIEEGTREGPFYVFALYRDPNTI